MNPKQLRLLMPRNAQDADAARELVSLGPNLMGPVVPEMLRHLKDYNSPVVDVYCEFFAKHGEQFVSAIRDALTRSTMPEIKNVIVTRILLHWSRDALAELTSTLQMLVTHTDFFNTDLVLIDLLNRHRLAEPKWLMDWLSFKRERLANLLREADEVRSRLV
jgi:hypothetical protein